MNALALIASQIEDYTEPLSLLMVAYPEPWSGKDASHVHELNKARAGAYRLAMEGLPAWCVAQSVKNFIQGRVDRKRREFLPTAEHVANEARRVLDLEVSRQHRLKMEADARAETERLLNPPEKTAEAKAKVARLTEQFLKNNEVSDG